VRVILVVVFILCAIDAFSADALGKISPKRKASTQFKHRQAKKSNVHALVGVGGGLWVEKSNDGRTMQPQGMPVVRLGMELFKQEVFLEVSGFKASSSSSGVEVARQHEQVELWYRYLFIPGEKMGHPFMGVALGAQRDRVQTKFFNQSSEDVGRFETQASIGGGYRFNIASSFALWFEGRLSTSANYEPRVIPAALISVGGIF
jgi:hypothetical protein